MRSSLNQISAKKNPQNRKKEERKKGIIEKVKTTEEFRCAHDLEEDRPRKWNHKGKKQEVRIPRNLDVRPIGGSEQKEKL